MRSSELSGAGASGFRAGTTASAQGVRPGPAGAIAWHQRLSPVTQAVALTAFLSAGIFALHDTTRTFDDMERKRIQTDQPMAHQTPGVADLGVTGPNGAAAHAGMASTSGAEPISASAAGPLDEDLAGLAARGMAAFGLAGLFTAATMRRRRTSEMPDLLQRQNYRELAAAIPMGIACWTRSGQMIVCNDHYSSRLGIDDTSLTYHQAVQRLIAGGYMKMLSEDDSNRLLELHREDGSYLLIDERPLGDGGFMTLVTDITERKRTDIMLLTIREQQRLLARRYHEEKLKAEAASRAKTNFLAHLSHDIRTPLNHIIGFAELMKHETYGPLGDPRYGEYLETIKSSGEHLLASFATILELAELESGQKALRMDVVPVDELIASVAKRFRDQIKRAGISLAIGQNCGAILCGDSLGLARMAGNIVENAIRFTPAGGRINFAAYAADDGVVIEISDTGIGMSEDRLDAISQPFALGDATFTRDGVGPGLGISIARAIAELSGGHMAIDSSPSLGTTVAISLPLAPAKSDLIAAE